MNDLLILDFSDRLAAYCTKLLADLGATVVKVEPVEGDPDRGRPPFKDGRPGPGHSLRFAYYHANKRSVSLDLRDPASRPVWQALVKDADVVVSSFTPAVGDALGIGPETIAALNQGAVFCSITPYGRTGPYRDYLATDLTLEAMGGQLFNRGPAEGPPVRMPGQQIIDLAGVHAAIAIMAALINRPAVGGQAIDLSIHEVQAAQGDFIQRFSMAAPIVTRGSRQPEPPAGQWPARNGNVTFSIMNQDQMVGALEMIGKLGWADRSPRSDGSQELRDAIAVYGRARTKEEIADEAQARRILASPVNSLGDFFRADQPRSRSYFTLVDHPTLGRVEFPGAPYRLSQELWGLRTPAPSLGQHNDDVLRELSHAPNATEPVTGGSVPPLQKVRVLSFGTAIAGNDCAVVLATLGPEVVKIESRGHPDLVRYLGAGDYVKANEPSGVPATGFHAGITHSKRNLSLNMADPRARELFKHLVAQTDVVVNNFSPMIMPRWGIDYDTLSAINPRLVMVSMPGLGKTGPKNFWLTIAPIVEAYVGLTKLGGQAHVSHADYVASTHAAFAVLVALRERERTGKGMFIDLAQSECEAAFLGPELLDVSVNGNDPEPPGNWVDGSSFSGIFRCQTPDSWIAVEAESEGAWRALCAVVGTDLTVDPRFATSALRRQNLDVLAPLVEGWTTRYTAFQAMRILQRAGVAAGVVQHGEDLGRDIQLRARGFMVEVTHSDLGTTELPESTLRLSKTPGKVRHAAHRLGEDNAELLGRIGLSSDDLATLAREGVI